MSAELTRNENGKAEMFSVRLTPWHREGEILTEAPDLDTALELGGLDFTVRKVPTEMIITAPEEMPFQEKLAGYEYDAEREAWITRKPSESAFSIIRTDRNQELGAVGPGYTPIQNRDMFATMEPLLDSGVLQLETGGSLRNGADVWLLGRFDLDRFGPVVREIFAEEVVPFALFTNNHNGRRGATVAETPIRVVCANTLGFAEHLMETGKSRSVSVRHTGDAETKIVEAAEELFLGIVERYETIAESYRILKATTLDDAAHKRLVLDPVAPDPRDSPKFNPDAKLAESVLERALTRREDLYRLWFEGDGHEGDRSAWEAYNGAVQSLDHNADLWPTRGGSWRTASLMTGAIRKRKDATLQALTRYAERNNDLAIEA